jgi:hypothetical protein
LSANGTPQISKGRTLTRDRQTAHVRRSDFRLARAGKVFEGVGVYVVAMKGKKWAKSWLSTTAPMLGAHQRG